MKENDGLRRSLKLVSFFILLAKFQIFREIWASVSSPSYLVFATDFHV
ncbi:hypothetical protein NC651_002773 [Populus alba x Populus x berolinensis]|nr:hypothetical protein NC651_002773 [Populus alba x Populus x berolinensis]